MINYATFTFSQVILKISRKYRPHTKDWEGTVFTGVCPHLGGTPVPGSFPDLWSQVLSGGYPSPGWGEGGYPSPGQDWVPLARRGLVYPQDRYGVLPPLPKTEQQRKHLLHVRYASCILHSRRRTFLYFLCWEDFSCTSQFCKEKCVVRYDFVILWHNVENCLSTSIPVSQKKKIIFQI